IDVPIAQRLRSVLRHGAADVIEQRRGIRPIAADGAHRFRRGESALPADKPVTDAALSLVAMTSRALLLEHLTAVADGAAAGRQAAAVAPDINVPAGNFGGCCNMANAVGTLRLRTRRETRTDQNKSCDADSTHWHW